MRSRTRSLTLAALTCLAFAGPGLAQETKPATRTDLPKAAKLLENARDAMGGKEAFEKVRSMMTEASMSVQGMDISMVSHWARGEGEDAKDKALLVQTIPQMGKMSFGSDGETHWANDPFQGYRLLSDEEFGQQGGLAGIQIQLVEEDEDIEMETVDLTEFNGQKCYKVRMKQKEGGDEEQFLFFDSKAGLPVGIEAEQPGMGGQPAKMTMIFAEWKEIDDLKFFSEIKMSQGPMMSFTMKFDKIEINKVDDAVFELPEQVKKMKKPATIGG